MDGVTATTAELNKMDGVTATTGELNYVDGVTSNIQNQLNTKYVAATQSTGTWQTGTGGTASLVTPANVKAAIDSLAPTQSTALGAVGTYAFLREAATITYDAGTTRPGSTLTYTNAGAEGSTAPSGTWRCMGYIRSPGNNTTTRVSLFVRIS